VRLIPWRKQGKSSASIRKSEVESKATGTLADPPDWLELLFAGDIFPSRAGVTISPLTAMTCSPVRCAVQAIAESVAQLPLEIFEQGENGDKSPNTNHPAYTLLHGAPNDWTPAATFIEQVTRDALLERHGGFAFINRVDGKPIELIRLDPLHSQVMPRYINGEPQYFVVEGGNERVIPRENILHIPSPSLHGILHDAKEAIGLALVMEQYAARLFGRGARPSGILKFDKKLDAATSARMKASWQAAHSGHHSGGTAIIEEGGEFQALTLNSVDTQFHQMRLFAVTEIARHFRVPPTFLYDFGRATWSNGEQMSGMFLTFTLIPWLLRWEGEIALKLFSQKERATFTAAFNTNSLQRANFQQRMQGYNQAISARVLNPNEARNWENLPPYEGGDIFLNPNVTPETVPVMPGPAE
jgi:HK97 family phage portal protein